MQKRLLLAFALSFVIIVAGQRLITKPTPHSLPAVNQSSAPTQLSSEALPSVNTTPLSPEGSKLTEFEFDTDLAKITFSDENASIKEANFKKFKNYMLPLNDGLFMGSGMVFKRQHVADKRVVYVASDVQKRITKELVFADSSYDFKLAVTVENISQQPLKLSFPLTLGVINPQGGRMVFHDVCVSLSDKAVYPDIRKDNNFSTVNFLSFRDNYFCAVIEPTSKDYSAHLKKVENNQTLISLQSPDFDIAVGQRITQEFRVYIGPQDLKILTRINPDWQTVVYFGKLDVIAQVLLKSLTFLHSVTSNWGVAIISLSFLIYVILFPLTLQQLRSMREMQRVAPKVEELRCKYREDPMRLQKETMALYKEHKINPLGGCLPMLLQIPVFVSFYLVLSRSIQLKGAGLLWIKDLSEPDKLFVFQQSLPFLGNELNLLPILMMGASFYQQKLSSGQMSGQSAEQQKMMMFLFPLMFGIFFYHMPAGLVLYWFSNTIFTLIQQSMIMKSK
jgi:YidC/Oxa1 family membrane protein insertase